MPRYRYGICLENKNISRVRVEQNCSIGNDVVSKGLFFFGKEGPFWGKKKGFSFVFRKKGLVETKTEQKKLDGEKDGKF